MPHRPPRGAHPGIPQSAAETTNWALFFHCFQFSLGELKMTVFIRVSSNSRSTLRKGLSKLIM